MSKKNRLILGVVSLAVITVLLSFYFRSHPVAVLDPKGIIAAKEKHLMLLTTGIMLIVVIPVFALTFLIVYRYRAPREATYTPNWDGNRALELLWWGFPLAIIIVLAVVAWRSSHELDPSRPIASSQSALNVQVIALQYKWLFIYPEQHIASLNYFAFPAQRPVSFHITSDAPMNSFWIPQLGGQVYAMSGMSMPLQLMADHPGNYRGVSANISGSGFANMHFNARATSDQDFTRWVKRASASRITLADETYRQLVQPASDTTERTYSHVPSGLYDAVVMKYLQPWDASKSLGGTVRGAGYGS